MTDSTIPLKKVTEEKEIYLVPLDKTVSGIDGITSYLAEYGLKPCENAPQYLLGLMATMTNEELPNTSWIVAADSASVFRDFGDGRCFLCVPRSGGERKLSLVYLGGDWSAGSAWVFLAESLDFSSIPLGSSELKEAIDLVKSKGYTVFKEY